MSNAVLAVSLTCKVRILASSETLPCAKWSGWVWVHRKLRNVNDLPVWKDSWSRQLSQSLSAWFLQDKSEAIWPKENLGQNAMVVPLGTFEASTDLTGSDDGS